MAFISTNAPIAVTEYGMIRGFSDGLVKVFKGVPYAASPAGNSRWLPPKRLSNWSGIRDARMPGPMCPQRFGAPMPEETVLLQRGPTSEDCLNLNIFTTDMGSQSKKRPVMVWLHGGGLEAGSPNATSYDGRNLADRHDVVLVAVAHRLNVFGFLYLGGLFGPSYADSGNVGMLDIVAALRWVKDNIAEFGGDAANITVFGESGGGQKISALLAMPVAQGLFKRAILQSYADVRSQDLTHSAHSAEVLLDALRVRTIEELKAIPEPRLLEAMESTNFHSGTVVDGRVLPVHPFDPAAPALSMDVPIMLGTLETEATFLPTTPLDPISDSEFEALLKAATQSSDADVTQLIEICRRANPGIDNTYLYQLIVSQVEFRDNLETVAERKAIQGGAPVYMYYFTHHTTARGGKLRAPHTLEIPYVFDNLAGAEPIVGAITSAEQALAGTVSETWVAFARTGNPNHPRIPFWPAFNPETRPTMIIDDEFKVVNDPLREMRIAVHRLRDKRISGATESRE
jgi:para-nitrobenzyl esterase